MADTDESDSISTDSRQPFRKLLNSRLEKLWPHAKRFGHRLLPNLILHPNETRLASYAEDDEKENTETRIPEGENFSLAAIWAVEVYGPSEIENLYENLLRLGWNRERFGNSYPGASHWINEQRMYGSRGSFNLGVVTRKGDNRFISRNKLHAALPPEVDYLITYLYQISASLTCLRVGFVLTDDAGVLYNEALNTNLKTQRQVEKPGRISYHGVVNSKIKLIAATRVRYRKIASDWMKKELPGFFCGAPDGNRIPTAELMFTDLESIFEDEKGPPEKNYFDWRKIVINASFLSTWTSKACDGLQFVADEFEGDERYHTVIALKTSSVPDTALRIKGGKTKSSLVNFAEDYVGGFLVLFSAMAFLREAERTVKLAREQLKLNKGRNNILKILQGIESYFTESIGQPSIAAELLNASCHEGAFSHRCEDFTKNSSSNGSEKDSLPIVLAKQTKYLSDKFIKEESSSREQFEQLTSILNTRESIKTQRRMEKWTLIALALAVASLVVALLAIPDDWLVRSTKFYEQIRHVFQ